MTRMANYNGLITTVQHRLSSTFSMLANWTCPNAWTSPTRQGDYAGTNVENPNNLALDYGPCGSDYPQYREHRPRRQQQLHSSMPLRGAIVNNWEFAPLAHISSGAHSP